MEDERNAFCEPASEPTIAGLLDFMFNTREQMRALEKEKTDLQKLYDDAEYQITVLMQDQDIRAAGTDLCTATLKQEKYPQIIDQEKFVTWCSDNNLSNMIQKRVSKAVFDEFFNQNGEYPDGIDTYDKLTIGIRKR